jgi:hypothetical protein
MGTREWLAFGSVVGHGCHVLVYQAYDSKERVLKRQIRKT